MVQILHHIKKRQETLSVPFPCPDGWKEEILEGHCWSTHMSVKLLRLVEQPDRNLDSNIAGLSQCASWDF